jgi:hypothetical protein
MAIWQPRLRPDLGHVAFQVGDLTLDVVEVTLHAIDPPAHDVDSGLELAPDMTTLSPFIRLRQRRRRCCHDAAARRPVRAPSV